MSSRCIHECACNKRLRTMCTANEGILSELLKHQGCCCLLEESHEIYVDEERRYLFDKLPSTNVKYCFVDIVAFYTRNCKLKVKCNLKKFAGSSSLKCSCFM